MRNRITLAAAAAVLMAAAAAAQTRFPVEADPFIRIDIRERGGGTEVEWWCSNYGSAQDDPEYYWLIEFGPLYGRTRTLETVMCDLRGGGEPLLGNDPPSAYREDGGTVLLDTLSRALSVDVWSPSLRDSAGRAKKPLRIMVGELPPGRAVSISTLFRNAPPR